MKKPRLLEPRWLLMFVFFLCGGFLGGLIIYLFVNADLPQAFKLHSGQSYQYINPLLAVDVEQPSHFGEDKTLFLVVQNLVENAKKSGDITDASIYFRDIEPAIWMGVNEDETFSPGYLMRLPIMFAYFKLAESDSGLLEDTMTFEGPHVSTEGSQAARQLVIGQSYAVGDLIHAMVVESNDDAAGLLFDNIDKGDLNEVFTDLGINFKEDKVHRDYISLKTYSLFYRILYNATYLNREYSEKALELLAEKNESRGISAGIPKAVPGVTRFSVRQTDAGFEIYNCGIVYFPQHPYLLCASDKGSDAAKLEDFMETLGKKVYEEIAYKYQ
jgi:beta-lactamase class A